MFLWYQTGLWKLRNWKSYIYKVSVVYKNRTERFGISRASNWLLNMIFCNCLKPLWFSEVRNSTAQQFAVIVTENIVLMLPVKKSLEKEARRYYKIDNVEIILWIICLTNFTTMKTRNKNEKKNDKNKKARRTSTILSSCIFNMKSSNNIKFSLV